ncbi:hypothetical protein TWF970_009210 [Orbilia oligospora]|uniref:F-box domain-containing protein n=1 Tax=Orbilia oligospora TaxID=2813651 RepID=A0A7C8V5R3_ORBOL|nr:hypothetical protein TWF970_009210 [Orbilia oligospora]
MDRLPLEILRQIASYLPYNSLSSLSYVSRKIRLAIHDWQIYKAIVDVPNHGSLRQLLGRYELDDLRVKWTRNPITAGMSPEECELYAKADYKCWTILAEEYKLMSPSFTRDFLQYGGIMAARAHPFTQLNLHRPVHLHNLGKLGRFHDLPNFEEGQRIVHESWTDLVHALDMESAPYIDTMDQPAQDDAPQEREVISAFQFQELCVRSVGLLGYKSKLLKLSNDSRIQSSSPPAVDSRRTSSGPLAIDIPFESFMKLPLPFKSDPKDFASCHLEIMTSKEFLEDGAWMGFNGYGLPRHLDLGIIGVNFIVVGESARTNGIGQTMDGSTSGLDYEDDYFEPYAWLREDQTNGGFLMLQGIADHREGKVHLRGRIFPASDGEVIWGIAMGTSGFGKKTGVVILGLTDLDN